MVYLGLSAAVLFGFGDVVRVDAGEAGREYAVAHVGFRFRLIAAKTLSWTRNVSKGGSIPVHEHRLRMSVSGSAPMFPPGAIWIVGGHDQDIWLQAGPSTPIFSSVADRAGRAVVKS